MKRAILFTTLVSIILFSCKKDEKEFERGNLLIQTQIAGNSGLQGNVNVQLFDLNIASNPQLTYDGNTNAAGEIDLREWIVGPQGVIAIWHDTLQNGDINTYTADTTVTITTNEATTLRVLLTL